MAKGSLTTKSSARKVARAAGIGGGRSRRRSTPWAYLGVIAVIVILGILGTVQSRDERLAQINSLGDTPPTVGTTWNEGYAVYVCGKFLPPISTNPAKSKDPQGITTRTPGIITIHPTVKAAAGKNAVLGKFASAVGMKLNAAELQVPGGKLYQDGDSCEGGPGHVYAKQFASVDDTVGQLYNGAKGQLPKLDPRSIPFNDQAMLVIAFVPANKASSIPPPPAYVINNLKKLEPASSPTSTTVPTSSTVPASPTTTS